MSNSPSSAQTNPVVSPSGGDWRAVGVLTLASVLSFMDRTVLNLLIEPIKNDLHLSDTQISLLVGFAFAALYVTVGLPIGRLADRMSRRLILFVGVMFWSVMTIFCGMARSFWQLFLARAGVGIGEATLTPCAHSLISDLFPREKLARALAVYATGSNIGAGLALIIGGKVVAWVMAMPPVALPFLGVMQPWQLAFFAVGGPGIVIAFLMLTLREPRQQRNKNTGDGKMAEMMPLRDVVRFLMTHKRLYGGILAGFALIASVSYSMAAWLPSLFQRRYNWEIAEIGLSYGLVVLLCGTTGTLIAGVLADRLKAGGHVDGTLRVSIVALTLALPCALMAPMAPTGETALVLLAPYWFFAAMPIALFPAALQEVTPPALRGQVAALSVFAVNLLGLTIGPVIVAMMTDYVFMAEGDLYLSLSLMAGLFAPLALAATICARRPFRMLMG